MASQDPYNRFPASVPGTAATATAAAAGVAAGVPATMAMTQGALLAGMYSANGHSEGSKDGSLSGCRPHQSESSTGSATFIKVKNTFVEVSDEDSDSGDDLGSKDMVDAMTCLGPRRPSLLSSPAAGGRRLSTGARAALEELEREYQQQAAAAAAAAALYDHYDLHGRNGSSSNNNKTNGSAQQGGMEGAVATSWKTPSANSALSAARGSGNAKTGTVRVSDVASHAGDTTIPGTVSGEEHAVTKNGSLKVKNTFLEVEDEEDEERSSDMRQLKTDPARRANGRGAMSALPSLPETLMEDPSSVMYVQPSANLAWQTPLASIVTATSPLASANLAMHFGLEDDMEPMDSSRLSSEEPSEENMCMLTTKSTIFGMSQVNSAALGARDSPRQASPVMYITPSSALASGALPDSPTSVNQFMNSVSNINTSIINNSNNSNNNSPSGAGGRPSPTSSTLRGSPTATTSEASPAASTNTGRKPVVLAPGVEPLDIRQPSMSIGSVTHGNGECRPCAWFWRPQGCTNGEECRHCHLCPAGEVKSRRKSKLASLKATAREAAAAAAAASVVSPTSSRGGSGVAVVMPPGPVQPGALSPHPSSPMAGGGGPTCFPASLPPSAPSSPTGMPTSPMGFMQPGRVRGGSSLQANPPPLQPRLPTHQLQASSPHGGHHHHGGLSPCGGSAMSAGGFFSPPPPPSQPPNIAGLT
mmetsp:Transcript_32009/g.68502  ORF Transcript_32009/g.68502 Transcript_32009/m.68502 type:complete len:701 (+) Transcript_32009:254-2356(+)